MSDLYILDGKTPVRAVSVEDWGRWFEDAERHVADLRDGDIRVSTVFLGIDHQWGSGPPKLFETMVFGGPLDGEQNRCSTWEQAEEMHREMARRVTEAVLRRREPMTSQEWNG